MTKIYNASGYAGNTSIGENAMSALIIAEKETRKVADQINTFFENEWKPWRAMVEKMQFSLFKDVKRL